MNIGIWNVKSMRDKTQDIIKELKQLNIDIAAISETKRKGNGIEELEDYIHIYIAECRKNSVRNVEYPL